MPLYSLFNSLPSRCLLFEQWILPITAEMETHCLLETSNQRCRHSLLVFVSVSIHSDQPLYKRYSCNNTDNWMIPHMSFILNKAGQSREESKGVDYSRIVLSNVILWVVYRSPDTSAIEKRNLHWLISAIFLLSGWRNLCGKMSQIPTNAHGHKVSISKR